MSPNSINNMVIHNNVPSNNLRTNNTTPRAPIKVMSDEFSKDFCEWFYTVLNKLQPECSHQQGDNLEPDIFYSNSKIEI